MNEETQKKGEACGEEQRCILCGLSIKQVLMRWYLSQDWQVTIRPVVNLTIFGSSFFHNRSDSKSNLLNIIIDWCVERELPGHYPLFTTLVYPTPRVYVKNIYFS